MVIHTFVNVNLAISTIRHVRHVLHVLEIQKYLHRVLQMPMHNVQIVSSHPLPHLIVIVDVHGHVTQDTINLEIVALSVPQRVRDIHINQKLVPPLKIAYVRVARNRPKHHGIVVMGVVGHVMRDIINLAVRAMHVHHPVLVIHRKQLLVHRHKTVYVQVVRNLPIQSFPRLQDAVGLVILAITKVAVIVLLVLHVQLNNRKQKVAHPHKIVNAGHYARLNLHQQVIVSPLVPKMPTIAIFGDVK